MDNRGDPCDLQHRLVAGREIRAVATILFFETMNLNGKAANVSGQYLKALRLRLKGGARSPRPADWLGRQAIACDLETLDLARMHEQALIAVIPTQVSARSRDAQIMQAGLFFLEVLTPIEKTRRATLEAVGRLKRSNESLNQRTIELTTSNTNLKREIVQRRAAEKALKQSEHHHKILLREARSMQQELRHLSHRILSAQEEERKDISRELHDEITQTLAGINVHLAALKMKATISNTRLNTKIATTQRLVEKSIEIVHRFARELRPLVLDDLGLIPALEAFLKTFVKKTGMVPRLDVFPEVERLAGDKRTVLFRVAQSALNNVAQHAQASAVRVSIRKQAGGVNLKITDNGRAFRVERVLHVRKNKRLGILGMRERVEMVGGRFTVQSSPGKGTTIQAQIPFNWDNSTG